MASYLPQGPPDYIPHVQPFRPDFNFYQAALEKKESQYKEGYNKISGLYGTMLNSPMLRDDNNDKRDQFFKDVNNSIQKISGLDLSLEENVDSAYKVFQPILDDTHIHKDMAFTKGYQNALQSAEGFRNCPDAKKCGGQYWDQGVQEVHYRAEDFKNADPDAAMQMSAPKFTPYIDANKMALDLAKEWGVETKYSVSSGGYMHTIKDGTSLELPLRDMLTSTVGNDPKVMAMKMTEAYLNRKNFIKSNTSTFGSEDAAEDVYNKQTADLIRKSTINANQTIDQHLANLNNTLGVAKIKQDKAKANGEPEDPRSSQFIQNLMAQIDNGKNLQNKNTVAGQNVDNQVLLGGSKELVRSKIDAAYAHVKLSYDMALAAKDYSQAHKEDIITGADPYALASFNHKNAMELAKFNKEEDYNIAIAKETFKWQLKQQNYNQTKMGGLSDAMPHSETVNVVGASTGPNSYPALRTSEEKTQVFNNALRQNQQDYITKFYDYNHAIITNPDSRPEEINFAKTQLKKGLGDLYDESTQTIRGGVKGLPQNLTAAYTTALGTVKEGALNPLHWIDNDNLNRFGEIEKKANTNQDLYSINDQYIEKGNNIIKNYINHEAGTNISDIDKEKLNLMFKPSPSGASNQLRISSPNEWKAQYSRISGVIKPEKLSEEYENTYAKYEKLYNSNPNIKVADASLVLSGAGGGRAAQGLDWDINGDASSAPNIKGLYDIKRNIETVLGNPNPSVGNIYITQGATGVTNIGDAASQNNPKLMSVLNKFLEDSNNPKISADTQGGRLITSTVAAGSADMTQYSLTFPETWLEKNVGTDKKHGPAYDIKDSKSITFYIPAKAANNYFYNSTQANPDDIRLNAGRTIPESYPNAGNFKVYKEGDKIKLEGMQKDVYAYRDPQSGKMVIIHSKEPLVNNWDANAINNQDAINQLRQAYNEKEAKFQRLEQLIRTYGVQSETGK